MCQDATELQIRQPVQQCDFVFHDDDVGGDTGGRREAVKVSVCTAGTLGSNGEFFTICQVHIDSALKTLDRHDLLEVVQHPVQCRRDLSALGDGGSLANTANDASIGKSSTAVGGFLADYSLTARAGGCRLITMMCVRIVPPRVRNKPGSVESLLTDITLGLYKLSVAGWMVFSVLVLGPLVGHWFVTVCAGEMMRSRKGQ